ncbi:MAG: diaminopimelate epimerase [Bacillota bacterium]|nr:diaminopimelate epimerase [Bacillota bacterium]
MNFTKWQGLGNDFILVETGNKGDSLPEDALPVFSRRICDRKFGVGGDGLVLLAPGSREVLSMRIFNSDGSEAEMCGNALRCVAKYAYERGLVEKRVFKVETKAGVKVSEVILEGQKVSAVRLDMGEPVLERELIPVLGTAGTKVIQEDLEVNGDSLKFTAVSMGNPHCLIFVSDVSSVDVQCLGPLLENHYLFPKRINVEFIEIKNQEEIVVRVWERGAGETLACGTGACASVVGGALTGRTGRRVRVNLPGGQLSVEWAENNHVYLTGPAEEVFQGSLKRDFLDCSEGRGL